MDKATLLAEHFKRGRYTEFEVMRVDWVPTGTEGAYSVIRMSIYYRVLFSFFNNQLIPVHPVTLYTQK
jgi:hypothetical protein